MNPLSEHVRRNEWAAALPDNLALSCGLETVERALQGLQTINRLLAANHTASQEEDEAVSDALGAYLAGGLHAAAEALAIYVYRHIGELRTKATEKTTK